MLTHQTFISAFQLKLKKKSDNTADIDNDLITVNNFFAHWIKEVTFSPWEVY